MHRFGGEPMERPDLAEVYDAFETPRADRGDLPFLNTPDARRLPGARARARRGRRTEQLGADPVLHELVIRHEHQHNETMLQTLNLARSWSVAARAPRRRPARAAHRTGDGRGRGRRASSWAAPGGFSYDNERPRHAVDVPAFHIGRTPITNATLPVASSRAAATSAASCGPRRPGAGRRSTTSPPAQLDRTTGASGGWTATSRWTPTSPSSTSPGSRPPPLPARTRRACRPRSSGRRRRPGTRTTGATRRYPWGDGAARARARQPRPARARHRGRRRPPGGRSASGCLGMLGDVWEWTASDFDGYPGFEAHPYREYSEVFFGEGHQVLRGGSWATAARVATPDLPQLGPAPAPPDLRRPADREGRLSMAVSPADDPASTSHLDEQAERRLADDVLDGLTKPFKELPPKHFYDSRGSELFDQHLRAARVLPDPHRDGDPARGGPGRGRRRAARRAGGAGQRGHHQGAPAAGRHGRAGHAAALRPGGRVRARGARGRRRAGRATTRT